MLKDIIAVTPLSGYRLHLRFEDGTEGTLGVCELVPFEGIFSPLADLDYFAQVKVNAELGTIHWPNGADLDPDVLYAHITGTTVGKF